MSTATLDIESRVERRGGAAIPRAAHGALIGLVLGIFSIFVVITAANSLRRVLAGARRFRWSASLSRCGRWQRSAANRSNTRAEHWPRLGLVLSLLFLIGGVSYGGYVYATEVPDGYTRISFNTMKPDELQERGGVAVPPDIAALEGQKIFIKGYIRPDSITVPRGIDRFLAGARQQPVLLRRPVEDQVLRPDRRRHDGRSSRRLFAGCDSHRRHAAHRAAKRGVRARAAPCFR